MYSIRNPDGRLTFGLLKTTFNGQVLDEVLSHQKAKFATISVRGREVLQKEHQTATVPGRQGAYFYRDTFGVREIIIQCLLQATDRKALLDSCSSINRLVQTSSPALLSFSDEIHRFYFAQFKEMGEWEEKRDEATFTLHFICYDPFKYSDVKQATGLRVNYAGDEDTKPIIRLTLSRGGSELRLLHLEKQEYIRLKGVYTSGNQIVINMKKRTITQNGRSILSDLDMVNSRFFSFSKGINTLSSSLSATVTSEFREVYL